MSFFVTLFIKCFVAKGFVCRVLECIRQGKRVSESRFEFHGDRARGVLAGGQRSVYGMFRQ